MKKKYEFILVFVPGTDKKEVKEALSGLKSILSDGGVSVKKEENMGSLDLRYSIKKQDKGDFWVLHLESEVGIKSGEANVYLEREKRVMRYLLLRDKN